MAYQNIFKNSTIMNRIFKPQNSVCFYRKFSPNQFRFLSEKNEIEDGQNHKVKKIELKLKSNLKKDQAKSQLESLVRKAETMKSVGPNERETINKKMAKPKMHVRQSARTNLEQVDLQDEPVDKLARGLDRRLVEAAKRVADRMPKHLAKKTEQQLLDSIHKQKNLTSDALKASQKEDFTESISYKLLKSSKSKDRISKTSRIDENVGSTVVKVKISPRPTETGFKIRKKSSLFSAECLGIFDPKGIYLTDQVNKNKFWEYLHQKKLECLVDSLPENHFEEMIKLTENGKLWLYPINNEQGLEHEENTPFYDHVLLDHLLKDFPVDGPIRKFMELVIMGLSQNPYISVERKREAIRFYRNFFQERHLLETSDQVVE